MHKQNVSYKYMPSCACRVSQLFSAHSTLRTLILPYTNNAQSFSPRVPALWQGRARVARGTPRGAGRGAGLAAPRASRSAPQPQSADRSL